MNTGASTYVVGFPRIGEQRELKKILEGYWEQKNSLEEVVGVARDLRQKHWLLQKEAGISFISSNDFSLYDGMLDTAVMLNAIPARFKDIKDEYERYFSMARGNKNAVAMEMTKWFNTNYHYIVPELSSDMEFALNASKIINEYVEAKECGIKTKINVIGPITFLALSKRVDGNQNTLELLPKILPCYVSLLEKLAELDDELYIQFDEPITVKDVDQRTIELLCSSYKELAVVNDKLKLIVMTYFDHATEAVASLADVPIYGIGLDFVYGKENLTTLDSLHGKKLFAGVVDGRNVWKNDYRETLELLKAIEMKVRKEDIIISTSCSLLHVPYSLEQEEQLAQDIKSWLSFSLEKLQELSELAALFSGDNAKNIAAILESNQRIFAEKQHLPKIVDSKVRERIGKVEPVERNEVFADRVAAQNKVLGLGAFPATTIGSFPQTAEIRKLRRDFKNKLISSSQYEEGIHSYIDSCIRFQEDIGLDVLVHGEPERNDMVEYFGEQLAGFVFTQNGWVQSYGSRCVKPPVIYGDVSRPNPMTVDTIAYAQSRTSKVVKGMLTGPVTILNWSFVRNDISRADVCEQIALAIRDEIADLQNAGIKIIQVDEAAFKEGYPLRKQKIVAYEEWAVRGFKLAVSSASIKTQIHTHMCYSDFNDIIHTIEKMDADVITIETSRSGNKLLQVFASNGYANEIGPGVYDIHSPRVPSVEELEEKIHQLMMVLPPEKLWINPDCGLKTRKWDEVKPSLTNMVKATQKIRRKIQ
ncbi:5-methyltetrahydropteroyltriglutamate--homocysteine S-methyltransferase [Desulforamulus aeronauticus]|uniref:5-methyltetrahydropteroyltriglutamate--homocysteine methyltransferase n=1 Tax=Desulforamulus aeronauticus DSM 10349 TaxID=1121421 RepID=A0A1M6QES8_9FIRM|nr:5-methyltetrahydropteroyltriglutamate--homocysteine S-methyltransferase [Desulforamulus aeronauticus]SHK18553.1 methionine synthase (B12-independent) [Desulforamulus aeronauticus DSM 10349]